MAQVAQGSDQGVVAQASAAKHFAGARRQLDNSQRSLAGHQNSAGSVLFPARDDNARMVNGFDTCILLPSGNQDMI
jgi:hypothetical protein